MSDNITNGAEAPDSGSRSAKENAQMQGNSSDCRLHVSSLTRNISAAHLKEIFGHFGSVKNVDLQVDPKLNISKGFAFVEFDNADDASRGQQFMDGGQIDGNKIKVTYVLVSSKRDRRVPSDSPRNSRRSRSPTRGVGGERGSRGNVQEEPRSDDWRRGRGAGGRPRSPERRRDRSPPGGNRPGPVSRRVPSPTRRRSPVRGGMLRRSRSPHRRGNSPVRGRGGGYRGGPRYDRSRSRDRRRVSRSRSPIPYRRRGRSSSASSSPSPRRQRRRRSRSSSSGSSYSSRSSYSSSGSSRSERSKSSRSPSRSPSS